MSGRDLVWTDRTLVVYEKQEIKLVKTLGYSCCLCLDRKRCLMCRKRLVQMMNHCLINPLYLLCYYLVISFVQLGIVPCSLNCHGLSRYDASTKKREKKTGHGYRLLHA